MSTPRFSLCNILKREFKNPTKRNIACDSAKNILQDHPELATRIFDKFPCLLHKNELAELTNQFRDIFMELDSSSISETEDGVDLALEADKKNITAWEKKIADIAIAELLDENGTIKNELIELLEWQDFQNELRSPALICSIVCAYLGAINQVIIHNLSKELANRSDIFLAVCGYVNKNCRTWVNHQIFESKEGLSTVKEEKYSKIQYHKILHWPNETFSFEKNQPGVFVVLGAVAAAAAILFFKKSISENDNTVGEKKKFNLFKA